MNDWQNVFSNRADYSDDIIAQSCIRTIARHIAKLSLSHTTSGRKNPDSSLNYLLQKSPNEYMTAYDFLYRMAFNALTQGNAYAFVERDGGNSPTAFWILESQTVEAREVDNVPYLLFRFSTGRSKVVPYSDIIHLKYNFTSGELIAKSNDNLQHNLSLLNTLEESFANSAINSGKLRGVAKIAGQIGQENWIKKSRALNQQMLDGQSGGIISTDNTIDFQPFLGNPAAADHNQVDFVRQNIYSYYGISEAIVSGSYDETQYNAFYENTIEPFAVNMAQEFTRKLFTRAQQIAGNEISVDAGRLNYASTATRVELIRQLRPLGILTTNQALAIMNLPPVPGGDDDRVRTLNVVSANIADDYQKSRAGTQKGGEKKK